MVPGADLNAVLECRTSCPETRLYNWQPVTVVPSYPVLLVGVWRKDSFTGDLTLTLKNTYSSSVIDGPWSLVRSPLYTSRELWYVRVLAEDWACCVLHVKYTSICVSCVQLGQKPSTFRLTYNNIPYCNVVWRSLMYEKSIQYYPVMKWTYIQKRQLCEYMLHLLYCWSAYHNIVNTRNNHGCATTVHH
jgi:hypothetical protein